MRMIVGLVLALAGVAIAVLPARFARYEQRQYAVILGSRVASRLTRALLLAVGVALVVPGVILALR
ncbi:hypothetical protein ACNTMW_02215 [Planosporangium sp. 12N6]|uniref:hypothetical protein n=1 Tax=Planosporangium spinosum TaxID=3402278 RepID=UPI003CE673C4